MTRFTKSEDLANQYRIIKKQGKVVFKEQTQKIEMKYNISTGVNLLCVAFQIALGLLH